MLGYFAKIDLGYDPQESREVIVPTFRQDLLQDRGSGRGGGQILMATTTSPPRSRQGESTMGKLPFKLRVEEIAREIAEFCGFSQGMAYSFESPKVFDKLRIPAGFSSLRRDGGDPESAGRGLQRDADHAAERNADFPCHEL